MDALYHVVAAQSLLYKIALTAFAVTAILILAYRALFIIHYPRNLPRVGAAEGVSWSDMRKRFHTDCTAVFTDAYENVSKLACDLTTKTHLTKPSRNTVLEARSSSVDSCIWPKR
jgi:hypothetical protein